MILKYLDKSAFFNDILEYNVFPTSGLIGKWEFEDNIEDTLGTYDLTSTSISYDTGILGKAGSFNGTNSECYSTDVNLRRIFDLQNNWSVNLWFYNTANTGIYCLFSCDGSNTPPYKRTWIQFLNVQPFSKIDIVRRGFVIKAVEVTETYVANRGTTNILSNVWNHVSINYDGIKMLVYVNGLESKPDGTNNFNFSMGNTDAQTTQTTIGGNAQNNVSQFKGYIDQVYVYNRALSFTEVNQIYNNGKGER